ncbi:MAG TPA: beta-galactosidase [Micromonosporaceae bacterium]|nr:beta-galactosidase [Micromonosporaceae bacterium]
MSAPRRTLLGAVRRLVAPIAASALLATSLVTGTPAQAAPVPGVPHTVTYDKHSFSIDGERMYLWAGEFHPWRLPSPDLWRDVLQKMKSGGYNAVSVYFHWGFHSPQRGVYDFTGVRDMDRFLDIAEEVGIYVIARPGPYINAETDAGGLPSWLTNSPARERSNEADYLAAVDEWLDAINPIIARHQLTNGTGTVILYQNENEFGSTDPGAVAYMQHLQDRARADGITVPTFHNEQGREPKWIPGTPGAPDLYAFDAYPAGFNCSNPTQWPELPDFSFVRDYTDVGPMFTAEFQGGSFDYWGGPGYEKCRQLTGPDFQRVFYQNNMSMGVTAQSFYMTYGGTSWGWLPAPSNVYTSYDYAAAISETRQLTEKYYGMKEMGYFVDAVRAFAKTERQPDVPASDPDVLIRELRNPDTGTRFHIARHTDGTSTATDAFTFALDGADGAYPTVPQRGAITLAGRDSKILVSGYDMERQRLVYSTSEILTHLRQGGRDIAALHGRSGQAGETVLRYASQPTVSVLSGTVASTWDAARGDLRLNYDHAGLAQVRISGGGRADLVLLIGDDAAVNRLWKQDTTAGPVLVLGPQLLRTAGATGATLQLTGDTDAATDLRVWAPDGIERITWNGARTNARRTPQGVFTGRLTGPRPVPLPALTNWRQSPGDPNSGVDVDDSLWTIANQTQTNNPTKPGEGQPVLNADQYGFHHGDVWYRGHFTPAGTETQVNLNAITGNAGVYSAWLNGTFLGSSGSGGATFDIPAGALRAGQDNVVAVLVRNMGHNQTYGNKGFMEPRGLTSATFLGASTAITWRLQGNTGGETPLDAVRGAYNNGGLYGENAGWSLPGFPDSGWARTTLPAATQAPGVTWYRTTANLRLRADQDTAVGIRISDDPTRRYRATIFVNGWNIGQYINDLGPQRVFPVPNGILNPRGENTIAIASWSVDGSAGIGAVSLENLGTVQGGIPVGNVPAPGYDAARFTPPVATGRVVVDAPADAEQGGSVTVRATYTPVADATGASLTLDATPGWTLTTPAAVDLGDVAAGTPVTATWQVTAPAFGTPRLVVLTATATATQGGQATTARGADSIAIPIPPPTGTVKVSDLPYSANNGWGEVERDRSNGESGATDGNPITINGVVYAKGLGVHAASAVRVFLGGNCTRFTAVVGVDDETGEFGSARFTVQVDGVNRVTTAVLRGPDDGLPIDVDVTGGQWLDLIADDAGDGNSSDHVDWADATLVCG